MERHLSPEGCAWCLERAQSFHAAQGRIAEWREPLPLPHPDALAAGTRGLYAIATSSDSVLEAELTEESTYLELEIRTREKGLNYGLFAYLLYGRQRRAVIEGFTVLRPDVDGWYTSYVAFAKGDLYARLSGCCERIVVSPVSPAHLTSAERGALLASVAGSEDEYSRRAWRRWLSDAERELASETVRNSVPPASLRQLAAVIAELNAGMSVGEQRPS